ncbi:hypothetical protein M758_12G025200 [Ceratodon purpureus]|nr:hypothetical protein M758_12G025200 [Ceratodon purpureus]KAG0597851.1 hypothetical protein M758_12G025200 [Ceratodon purpureus]
MSTPVSDRNGRTTAVVPELEMIKELKAMNDQIRERCQRLEEAEKHSLMFMIDRNRKLEAQIIAYQQEIRVQDRNLNKAIRERDNVRILLEEVRLLRERDDEEIRKKLKVELLRASELESENHRLRFARC